ncbi:MAG: 2-oxo acid dehydrogenase subunit E2 [Sedimentibacter sp.]|uniref:2-oxo acid dehydrogenase subunit E2 n=1 Tax=Sedimentibacter sp. TaxID=1960295 RepID=UPI00315946BB
MAEIIIMPKLGFNMSVGKLVSWYMNEGDQVKKGDPVFAVETDKTSIDIEATQDGFFRKKFIEEGESVNVTLPIAIIADKNENIDEIINDCLAQLGNKGAESNEEAKAQTLAAVKQEAVSITSVDGKIKITPRARRMAAEKGVDITELNIVGTGYKGGISEKDLLDYLANNKVKVTPLAKKLAEVENIDIKDALGSGINGKILKKDVEALIKREDIQETAASDETFINGKEVLEISEYTGVRKIIGDRLSQSFVTSPHVFFTQKINLQKLLDLRKDINIVIESKTSVTDYIVKAAVKALQKYSDVNAALKGQKIIKYKTVNVGIAVAAPNGLIVPVVKNAEKMDVIEISKASGVLVEKARNGKLIPDEYTGGTFTISNLGMVGIENFTAIINPPEAAILAVSSTKDEVVVEVGENGNREMVIRPMMNITLSADHRIIDGMLAAQFVGEIKRLLENPLSLLL